FVPCARQHRQQQTCEQSDDGNDDEQLDQRKGMRPASGTSALRLESDSHFNRGGKLAGCYLLTTTGCTKATVPWTKASHGQWAGMIQWSCPGLSGRVNIEQPFTGPALAILAPTRAITFRAFSPENVLEILRLSAESRYGSLRATVARARR